MDAKNCIFRDIVIYGQYSINNVVRHIDGELVVFKHEKNNIHDKFAVMACNRAGKPLGWVPKEISPAICRLLKDGYIVEGIAGNRRTRMWAHQEGSNFACDVYAKKGKKSCK